MRIFSHNLTPCFAARSTQNDSLKSPKVAPPLFTVQPGDIFAPSTPRPEPNPAPQNPSLQAVHFGRGHLRVRPADERLADTLIVQTGSATEALLHLAQCPQDREPDDHSTARILQALIHKQAEVNQVNQSGATPLLIAIATNNLAAASVLLDNGATINRKHEVETEHLLHVPDAPSFILLESKTTYPILEARSTRMLKLLLERGANINVIGQNHNTKRQFSVFDDLGDKQTERMKVLMKFNPESKAPTVAFQNTLAPQSSLWISGNWNKELEEMKLLLKAGAIPSDKELKKLDCLLGESKHYKQLSDLYVPYPQPRRVEALQKLLEIHQMLQERREEATLETDHLVEDMILRYAHKKLNPEGYLQALKDCRSLKENLQKGADPTYGVIQLIWMHENNKRTFGTTLDAPESIKAEQEPTKPSRRQPQTAGMRTIPSLKWNNANSFARILNHDPLASKLPQSE